MASKTRTPLALTALALLALTGCSSQPSGPREMVTGLHSKDLCSIVQDPIATDALAGATFKEPETYDSDDGNAECRIPSSDDTQGVKLSVGYAMRTVGDKRSIYKSLTDGGANSKEQCSDGGSMPAVTEHLTDEVAMICNKGDNKTSTFEYTGATRNGGFTVNVTRNATDGAITAEQAQKWVDAVASKALQPAGN